MSFGADKLTIKVKRHLSLRDSIHLDFANKTPIFCLSRKRDSSSSMVK